jgi:hypothetical protein
MEVNTFFGPYPYFKVNSRKLEAAKVVTPHMGSGWACPVFSDSEEGII